MDGSLPGACTGQASPALPPIQWSIQPPQLASRRACGTGLFERELAGVFKYDTWHTVELGLRLNTPGRADGAFYVSVDGKKQGIDGVTWRTGGAMQVEYFTLTTFHGGPCKATKTSSASFRNVGIRAW